MTLKGREAIVTGGARGVAKGVALAFARAGASVLIVDREETLGRETEAELRAIAPASAFLLADLSRHDDLPRIVNDAIARFGKLDILVNAAQAAQLLPLAETTNDAMRLPFDTGFWPTFVLMRTAYPYLRASRGCVINFGSGASFDALPTQAAYAAAKEAFVRSRILLVCRRGRITRRPTMPPSSRKCLCGELADCKTDIGAAAVFWRAVSRATSPAGHSRSMAGRQRRSEGRNTATRGET